jgi:diaminopimelate epimerase
LSPVNAILPEFYRLPFIKMQALGNDLIFLDAEELLNSSARPLLSQWQNIAPILVKELCNRRFGIGADGLVLAMRLEVPELAQMASQLYGPRSKGCDLSWTYHNSDGSISDMCGNGLRCLSLWATKEKNMNNDLMVATALGPLSLKYKNQTEITVSLGAPKLLAKEIPFLSNTQSSIIKEKFSLADISFPITCVNVGNPHCVIFEANFLNPQLFDSLNDFRKIRDNSNFFPAQLISIAEALETDKHFPAHTNVEFVNVVDRHHIQVFVWERGSKATLACGSAAAATAIASILEDRTDNKVKVTLPGGTLMIDWSDKHNIKMTGSANFSFKGHVEVSTKNLTSSQTKVKV